MEHITLTIESLNEKGYGVAFFEGKEYHVLNALLGEQVNAQEVKRKKGIRYALAEQIIQASPDRIMPQEDHFLSCSPWQLMKLEAEDHSKKELIQALYQAHNIILPDFEVVSSSKEYEYRNKVEFSFYGDELETLHLAFHKRDGRFAKVIVTDCKLAPVEINQAAQTVLAFLNKKLIKRSQLKALQLRYSFLENKVIGILFVKDSQIDITEDEILSLIRGNLVGFSLIYSTPKSPACVETEILFRIGQGELTEKILDLKLTYPAHGFFQVNPAAFESPAQDIRNIIQQIPEHLTMNVVDLYAGVGTIGLLVSSLVKTVVGVELFEESKQYALKNAELNQITNFSFIQDKAEKAVLEVIGSADILIVDSTRAGLHPKVIKRIYEHRPQYIIYLSCNPKSQAHDIAQLKELYKIIFFKAYNFYPRTPHVESLAVLTNTFQEVF